MTVEENSLDEQRDEEEEDEHEGDERSLTDLPDVAVERQRQHYHHGEHKYDQLSAPQSRVLYRVCAKSHHAVLYNLIVTV